MSLSYIRAAIELISDTDMEAFEAYPRDILNY